MEQLLTRKDLSNDDKLKLFQAAQTRFERLSSGRPLSLQAQPIEAPAPAAAAAAALADIPEDAEVEQPEEQRPVFPMKKRPYRFPIQKYQKRALTRFQLSPIYLSKLTKFTKFLTNHRAHISANSDNELVLHDEPISGASYSDLVSELFRSNKKHNLTGMQNFLGMLRELGTPSHLISNSKYIDELGGISSSSGSSSLSFHPSFPGVPPRIQHVYK